MTNDLHDAPWAKDAVRAIEQAIADHNKHAEKDDKIMVQWGYHDKGHEEAESRLDPDERTQCGLLDLGGWSIELRIFRPDEGLPADCRLTIYLNLPFRLYPREVFNAVHSLDRNCQFVVCRGDGEKIYLLAVHTWFYLTAPLHSACFVDTLKSLGASALSLRDHIADDDGDDFWEEENEVDDDD
jgi:hypothetical protein